MLTPSRARQRTISVCAAAAALGGVAAAIAVPVSSAVGSTATPVVTAYAIPGSSDTDTVAIAAAAGGGSAEWIIDSPGSGNPTLLSEPVSGGAPAPVSGAELGTAGFQNSQGGGAGVLINDGSYDLAANLDNTLYSLNAAGTASTGTSNEAGATVTLGPDGNLYGGQDGTYLDETTLSNGVPGATSVDQLPSNYPPGAGGIDALTSGDGLIWFTTQAGVLGAYEPGVSDTGGAAVSGPYDVTSGSSANPDTEAGPLSSAPGTVAYDNGEVYVPVAPGSTGSATAFPAIAAFSASNPTAAPTVIAAGIPANANITSLTTGPDGNVWFLDAANNAVGELNLSTDQASEYALPSGFTLSAFGSALVPGPSGSATLFYTATDTATSQEAIGEVTLPAPAPTSTGTTSTATTTTSTAPPAPAPTPGTATTPTTFAPTTVSGKLTLAGTAAVSTKGEAALKLSCKGGACSGKLTLTVAKKTKVKQKVKGKLKTVIKTTTLTLGSTSYSLATGATKTVDLKLSATGEKDLDAAKNRKLAVSVTIVPASGAKSTAKLTLVGAKATTTKKK